MSLPHRQDSDCTVDPETGCCIECYAEHGNPCLACNGRGYHDDNCEKFYADSQFREECDLLVKPFCSMGTLP